MEGPVEVRMESVGVRPAMLLLERRNDAPSSSVDVVVELSELATEDVDP